MSIMEGQWFDEVLTLVVIVALIGLATHSLLPQHQQPPKSLPVKVTSSAALITTKPSGLVTSQAQKQPTATPPHQSVAQKNMPRQVATATFQKPALSSAQVRRSAPQARTNNLVQVAEAIHGATCTVSPRRVNIKLGVSLGPQSLPNVSGTVLADSKCVTT